MLLPPQRWDLNTSPLRPQNHTKRKKKVKKTSLAPTIHFSEVFKSKARDCDINDCGSGSLVRKARLCLGGGGMWGSVGACVPEGGPLRLPLERGNLDGDGIHSS